MRISVVGAGPVGLLTACLLSQKHAVTILDKRTESTRNHGLSIDSNTINVIIKYLESVRPTEQFSENVIEYLCNILRSWTNTSVSTVDIESQLSDIAERLGVNIRRGANVESIDDVEDNIIIGADGAHSKIRHIVFGDKKVDIHEVQYMAQLKYQTPGATRPRLAVSAMSYSFLNGLSGHDMVVDFESLSPPNDQLRKPGTLHIPIPENVYDVLSQNGRGNYNNPWSLEELGQTNHSQVAKLFRIFKRYEFSLKCRGGWLEDARVTVIPLTIYRSSDVVRVLDNKVVMLVGDSSSGLVYQRGLNKGWLEAVQCAITLDEPSLQVLSKRLDEYTQYCVKLYESERDRIFIKHNRIISANASTTATGLILTSGLLITLGALLSRVLTS